MLALNFYPTDETGEPLLPETGEKSAPINQPPPIKRPFWDKHRKVVNGVLITVISAAILAFFGAFFTMWSDTRNFKSTINKLRTDITDVEINQQEDINDFDFSFSSEFTDQQEQINLLNQISNEIEIAINEINTKN